MRKTASPTPQSSIRAASTAYASASGTSSNPPMMQYPSTMRYVPSA